MRYYIADCHFWHAALNDHMDCRGFASVGEMNEHMIECWNRRVRPCDEVVILGDLSWGDAARTTEILERLNGRLYLIRGNHDRYLKDPAFDASRFEWIRDYAELSDNRRKVVLSHYPMACYNGQYRLDEQGSPRSYMLHGHIHDTMDQALLDAWQDMASSTMVTDPGGRRRPVPCHLINCFCQYSGYMPLTLDEWIETDRKRRETQKEREFDGETGVKEGCQGAVCPDQGHIPAQDPGR